LEGSVTNGDRLGACPGRVFGQAYRIRHTGVQRAAVARESTLRHALCGGRSPTDPHTPVQQCGAEVWGRSASAAWGRTGLRYLGEAMEVGSEERKLRYL
jgi:hypothetical protein